MNACNHAVAVAVTAVFAACVAFPCRAQAQVRETTLSSDEWRKLDTFENHSLSKANETFKEKTWRQAYAEYDSFLVEFPRSRAIPFVLLRKGRCRQEDGKLFSAVEEYEEVLDYFPNHVRYAAPALYRIGECHHDKGDLKEAMQAWAEMANDEDYVQHPLAALAMNALADSLMSQGEDREAVKYYERVAVLFKDANRAAADRAAGPVTAYYMRTMQEEAYRAFYTRRRVRATRRDETVSLDESPTYWNHVMQNVGKHGTFDATREEIRNKYYAYWIGKLQNRFPLNDAYQLRLIDWQYDVDGDPVRWSRNMDEQFQRRYVAGDNGRVIWWMRLCSRYPEKVDEYYRKIDRDTLNLGHKISLIDFLYSNERPRQGREVINLIAADELSYEEQKALVFQFYKVGLKEDAGALLGKIHYGALTDDQIEQFGNELGRPGRDPEKMLWVWYRMQDQDRARSLHMRHCHRTRQAKQGLPVATALTAVDDYAQAAWLCKADFHKWIGQYEEAIGAYRSSDDPPVNLWGIVECEIARRRHDEAITQLEEIETFFEKERPRAAFAIADVYRKAGNDARYIASLRAVLKKYPETRESSQAHQLLEKMGVKMGGAVDAE